MDLNWVRSIATQCDEYQVAHFFKQYYKQEQGVPVTDGMLGGNLHQEWPIGDTYIYTPVQEQEVIAL